MSDSPHEIAHFNTGAVRSSVKPRYDLIPVQFLQALAEHCTKGAEKYGCQNWQKGGEDFILDAYNHLIEHSHKAAAGMTDENHLIAVAWNAMAIFCLESEKRIPLSPTGSFRIFESPANTVSSSDISTHCVTTTKPKAQSPKPKAQTPKPKAQSPKHEH